jgi:acyl carrier protein
VNPDDVHAIALDVLSGIAPESTGIELQGDVALREQIDLDSMDFLNLLIGVHERLAVDIAEDDYARCETLDGLVETFVRAAESTR